MSKELYKAQAARLVKFLAENHKFRLKHASSLEAIAALHGLRNWNTLIAEQSDASNLPAGMPAPSAPLGNGAPASPPLTNLEEGRCALRSVATRAGDITPAARPVPVEDAESAVWAEFMRALPEMAPFMADTSKNGMQKMGWRVGNRLYLLEIKFREWITGRLPPNVLASVAGTRVGALKPVTLALLKGFAERGWLVTQSDCYQVPLALALWNVQMGKLFWKGVVVIDLPADVSILLDCAETVYPVSITGPLFAGRN
ncbi:hypothetical protein F6X40_10020 [Paraburkholderia sp. UCT31]|uniref:glyoxalase superfamily protein n=1 Tax=Paraburkholderia sp. UCT31 TaxID=2615209 RepID=UPI001655AA51|nr:glyoxalase superfamily protein [Paraburkholderia sp. UCT31]MBC8737143.1 hypothetical protein [Paraburkholderia sp. UCT31]